MRQVLGDLFPYAVPVALSPLPIIAVVMLLLAPAGGRGGLAFLLGRVATLFATALMFAALAGAVDGPGRGEIRAWLRILLGLLLMAGAAAVWRKDRAAGDATAPKGPLAAIDRATPAAALRLGAVLTVVNVKELAFALGAGAIIGGAELGPGQLAGAALAFAAIAGLGVAVPVAALLAGGTGVRGRLAAVRDWLLRYQAVAIAAVPLVIGAMLIGSGIEAL